MTLLYPNLGRWLLPLCFIPCCLDTTAQKKPSPSLTYVMSRRTAFIVHAPVLLPEMLKQQHYDTMANFLANWRTSEVPSLELVFGGEALLAIETGKFSSWLLPCDCPLYLADLARELKKVNTQGGNFRYYLAMRQRYTSGQVTYDATIEARNLILFYQSWARDLLSRPYLDEDELFICHVIAGDIADPKTVIHTDPASCPRVAHVGHVIDVYDNAVFTTRRNHITGTVAVLAGWWSPTGNLREVLGSHPSLGLQFGVRSKLNEYDITWALRFGCPAQHYTYIRKDTAYNSGYYDGGYIGFEYTRYFIHDKHFDIGATTGMGYDYFSVANGWGNDPDLTHLEPFNVGSVDWNSGLRIKYFFKHRNYIGLTAKYHLIHYNNDGGTNVDGDAYTLDLSFGSH